MSIKTSSKRLYTNIDKEDIELMPPYLNESEINLETKIDKNNFPVEVSLKSKKKNHINSESVKTFCRIRPINNENDMFKIREDLDYRTLVVNCDDKLLKKLNIMQNFSFSRIFDESSKQIEVFEHTCKSLVDDLIRLKKSGLIFTYGMTNSGKTYTVIGTPSDPGMLPMSLKYLYQQQCDNLEVYCNFVEVYNEDVYDLLATDQKNKFFKKKLQVKENNRRLFYLPEVTYTKISSLEDFNNALNKGIMKKVHAATNLNGNSSRSHTIFKIILKSSSIADEDISLSIVDLAGSERANRTEAQGKELQEACKINLSLSVLGKCLESLRHNSIFTNKKMVPFRESRLTMLFQEYFQGDQNIIMITNINPRKEDFEESVRALNYSCIAKDIKPIKSKVIVNPLKKHVKLLSSTENKMIEDVQINTLNKNENIICENSDSIEISNNELNFLKLEMEKLKNEFFSFKNKVTNDENNPKCDTNDSTYPEVVKSLPVNSDDDNNSREIIRFQSNMGQISERIQSMQMMQTMKLFTDNNPSSMMFPHYNQNQNSLISNDDLYNLIQAEPKNPFNMEFTPPNSFNLIFINSKFNDFYMGPKEKSINNNNNGGRRRNKGEKPPMMDLMNILNNTELENINENNKDEEKLIENENKVLEQTFENIKKKIKVRQENTFNFENNKTNKKKKKGNGKNKKKVKNKKNIGENFNNQEFDDFIEDIIKEFNYESDIDQLAMYEILKGNI